MFLYLIRHGQTDWNRDRLIMGRTPVPLNEAGRTSAFNLARELAIKKIPVIYTSTVERARETARILAASWEAEVREEPRLDESTFDDWVGKSFAELCDDEQFKLYFEKPTVSRFSRGEGIADVQRRALEAVGRIRDEARTGRAAIVSHSDVIKPIIAHYLGMELDAIHRLSIANSSASLVEFPEHEPRVRYVNFAPWAWRDTPR